MLCGVPSFWIGVASSVLVALVPAGALFWFILLSDLFGPGPPPGPPPGPA